MCSVYWKQNDFFHKDSILKEPKQQLWDCIKSYKLGITQNFFVLITVYSVNIVMGIIG